MFTLEGSYSLLLLHFRSRKLISTCFHFAFYKAGFRLCQDPFPLLPFMINKVFFPFSWLRPCQTDEPRRLLRVLPRRWGRAKTPSFLPQHLRCCHSPAAELQSGQQLWRHRCHCHGRPAPPRPMDIVRQDSQPDSSLRQWRETGTWRRDRCK